MRLISLLTVLLINTPSYGTTTMEFKDLAPPIAEKRPKISSYHGRTLHDDYQWLRDAAWETAEDGVKDPQILDYIEAENAYTKAYYQPLESLVTRLFEERKEFLPDQDQSVPIKNGDWFYYARQAKDQNYSVFCRRFQSLAAEEQVLMDENLEAQGQKYYKVGARRLNPEQTLMAYNVDCLGNEYFSVKIRDLKTNTDLSDEVKNVSGGIVWSPDSSGFYYVRLVGEWRPKTLCYHKLGTDCAEDTELYHETDDIATVGIGQSADKKYLFFNSGTKEEDALWFIDLHNNQGLIPLRERQAKRHLSVEHYKGHFYFHTNDVGTNFRLTRVPVEHHQNDFEEIIAHHESIYLTAFDVSEQGMVVQTREFGLNKIGILSDQDFIIRYLAMPDNAYDLSLAMTNYQDPKIRFTYSSLAKPLTTFAADYQDMSLETLKVDYTPDSFAGDSLETDRFYITARDGVEVPVSLVYRRDLFKGDGSNPLLLYGYGSYGYSIPASFRPGIIPLLDRGFVYAIAHMRGGDDLGYQWYLDGKLDKKWNTFNDFIDTADSLIARKISSLGNITAMGGSAGGMLMGVIANERPELFRAIVAQVPFVDVMNTMLDGKLPLTPGEYVEWGNPETDAKAFDYMMSYSPYDNVKKQAYPAILATGGLTDPRVTYWEMTKWVAKLRDHSLSNRTILLEMVMNAGHGGGSARDDYFLEMAKAYAFMLNEHGITA